MMGNRNTRDLGELEVMGRFSYGQPRSKASSAIKTMVRRRERRSAKQARYADRERADCCGRTMLERYLSQWSWEPEYECPE